MENSLWLRQVLCPVLGNRFNLLLPSARADWRSLPKGISKARNMDNIYHFPQVIQSLFCCCCFEENDNKWGWQWKRDPMNGFHFLLLAYHQTNEDTTCIRIPWVRGLTTKLSCFLPLSTAYLLAKRDALILYWCNSWSRDSWWPVCPASTTLPQTLLPAPVTKENHKAKCKVTLKYLFFCNSGLSQPQ